MRRSRWDPALEDAFVAAASTIALIVELSAMPNRHGPLALNLMAYVPVGVALLWRRRRPLVPVVVLLIGYGVGTIWLTKVPDLSTTMPPVLLTSYAAGRYLADLRPIVVLGPASVGVVCAGADLGNLDNWIVACTLYGVGFFVGRALRERRLVAAQLAERNERIAAEEELRVAEAAADERRRIARELHDVVAHTLSVMVVQAGAARRTLERDAARADEALETVETTGRAALGELRRLLGFVGEGSAAAPLEPQPTLSDMEALVRRAGAAGLPATLRMDGTPVALPAGAEVALYRIAQEALTNALKHAGPGASATVTLRWSAGTVELEVCDDGRGSGPQLPAGGHGVIGMRERATLFGGTLEAGPAAGGGYRVRARIPVAATEAVPA